MGEYDSTGSVKKTYAWMPNSTWGTAPVLMVENGQTYYYHNDHLGTPHKMTDESGATVWSATYAAFGEAVVSPSSTITNNLRFPGQYYDVETGLHYNYHRYYNPQTGRYTQKDPIGFAGGDANLYRYAGGDPVGLIDPLGLQNPLSWLYWNIQGPVLVTDMSSNTTTFYPGFLNKDTTYEIETRNVVARTSQPGAQDPFTTKDVTPIGTINSKAYGPNGAYIDTNDSRGRDIHGGGTGLPDSFAKRQGWMPTFGCTRGQNEDLQELSRRLLDYKRKHPNTKVPYVRHK